MSVTANKMFIFVDSAFERILKRVLPGRYPLQPIFVEKAVEKAITENTKVFKNGVLPPNRITVLMNREDYEEFKKIEGIYTRQLEQTAKNFIENEFREHAMGISRPVITIAANPDVTKGDVEVEAEHYEGSYEGLK
jgi:hypothetical protein